LKKFLKKLRKQSILKYIKIRILCIFGKSGSGKTCTIEYTLDILKENYKIVKCSGSLSYKLLVTQFYNEIFQKCRGLPKNEFREAELLEEIRKYIENSKEKVYFLMKFKIRICAIEEADMIEGMVIFFAQMVEYSEYLKFIRIFLSKTE